MSNGEGNEGNEGQETPVEQTEATDPNKTTAAEMFVDRLAPLMDDGKSQLDLGILTLILDVVMNLLRNCPLANADRYRRRVINRRLLFIEFRQYDALNELGRDGMWKAADKVMEVANDAGDEEIEQFVRECKEK